MREHTERLHIGPLDQPIDGQHALLQEIGERLDSVCAGMSLSDLTALTGMSKETIRRQLRDGRPGLDLIAALCGALDLSADWILCGRGGPYAGEAADEREADEDRSAVIFDPD